MDMAASAFLALDSSSTITTVGKQETLVTCCLLCVSAGLLPVQLCGAFFDACVHLYLQERKPFKLYVLSVASQAFRRYFAFQGLRK